MESPDTRARLSDMEKGQMEVDEYNVSDGVAGVADYQLQRDERDVVSNVFCY